MTAGRTPPRPRAPRPGGDEGITLIEVLVALVLMSVVMAVFTGAIIKIYHVNGREQSTTDAQAQVNVAFIRLDRELRYAAGVSTPGTVAGDPYVEYLTTNTGASVCTELRLHTVSGVSQLQWRRWTQPSQPGAFGPLVVGVTGSTPFTVHPADATYAFQRLEVNLTAGTGTTRQSDVTFTALNTAVATDNSTICSEGRTAP